MEKGLPFIEVAQNEIYEIRIHNRSAEEVAARVFIDGIDVFQFSDDRDPADPAKPRFTHLMVPGKPSGESAAIETVPGWHKSVAGTENFLAFLVTKYGEGASRKGVTAQGPVGVIHVQFSRTRALADDGSPRGAGNETGFGPPREAQQIAVRREVEPPTELVSIRYTR